ncbi:MAG: glycosyltransferase family 4 protein, partial [Candidatus Bathyarchaeia archaeon]
IGLIDAHDWHFIQAAVTLKKAFGIPFVYSVESLEEHRSHGANFPFNMAIKSLEWLGMYEAKQLIVKSEWMRNEIMRIYQVPAEKIRVITPESKNWIKEVLNIYATVAGGLDAE